MSFGQVASPQQQSAPPVSPSQAEAAPALGAAPVSGSPPVSTPETPATAPPAAGPGAKIGDNGGPDWRALLAGEDTKALETLSRFKEPGEFLKSHNELRAKLSERPTVAKLADNATAEQVVEYRKGLGLPDVPAGAKPDAYLDAYKIKIPEGYKASEVEKGMLGDYAKLAYEKGHSPREVNEAVGFFFQQQAANIQAMNRLAVDRQKEWQGQMRDQMGSKEYDAQLNAANAWLQNKFADQPDTLVELTRAQLPGGGYLGDHPAFFDIITKLAVGDGFTDQIEANAIESGGKSLQAQQLELENLMYTDRARYNLPENQARLDKIIGLRMSRGEIDEQGLEVKKRRA